MSLYWTRAIVPTHCGLCDTVVRPGDPLYVIKLAQVRPKFRCGTCQTPPPDLPTDIVQGPPPPESPADIPRRSVLDYGDPDDNGRGNG